MTADRGRGYNSSDKNKKPNQDISVLPIDSIYTPCLLYTSRCV